MDDADGCFAMLAGCLIVGVSAFFLGVNSTRDEIRDDAIANHHAEYFLDEKNERQWRWLPPCGEATP